MRSASAPAGAAQRTFTAITARHDQARRREREPAPVVEIRSAGTGRRRTPKPKKLTTFPSWMIQTARGRVRLAVAEERDDTHHGNSRSRGAGELNRERSQRSAGSAITARPKSGDIASENDRTGSSRRVPWARGAAGGAGCGATAAACSRSSRSSCSLIARAVRQRGRVACSSATTATRPFIYAAGRRPASRLGLDTRPNPLYPPFGEYGNLVPPPDEKRAVRARCRGPIGPVADPPARRPAHCSRSRSEP